MWQGVLQAIAQTCGADAEAAGVEVVGAQDASAIFEEGRPTTKEHFGYTDGFGNPDFRDIERSTQPGQGKMTEAGRWEPLATGELLLGYADEAGELPIAPLPHVFANNGTFMVYRKLHQNVATFRSFREHQAARYGGCKEKFAAKLIGRWRDGTPIELSPDHPDPSIVADPQRSTNFTFGGDPDSTRWPVGAHLRRVQPRDAFGFDGKLINRRRLTRRGLPYGAAVPPDETASDKDDRGIIFWRSTRPSRGSSNSFSSSGSTTATTHTRETIKMF